MVKLFKKLKKIGKGISKDVAGLASKGSKALKEHAEKAPERRQARLLKLDQQTELAEAEARLARAKGAKQQARAANRPAGGMGMGSPSMGMGFSMGSSARTPRAAPTMGTPKAAPAAKPKASKKRKGRSITIKY